MPYIFGKNGVVLKDSTEIAEISDIGVTVSREVREVRVMGDDKAKDIVGTDLSIRGTIQKYYDKGVILFDEILSGTPVTIKFRPEGTGANKEEYTLTGVIITDWDLDQTRNEYVRLRVRFTAKDIQKGSQS